MGTMRPTRLGKTQRRSQTPCTRRAAVTLCVLTNLPIKGATVTITGANRQWRTQRDRFERKVFQGIPPIQEIDGAYEEDSFDLTTLVLQAPTEVVDRFLACVAPRFRSEIREHLLWISQNARRLGFRARASARRGRRPAPELVSIP